MTPLNSNFYSSVYTIPMQEVPTDYQGSYLWYGVSNAQAAYTKRSTDGKTLYWYALTNAYQQYNNSGWVYCYFILG